MSTYSFFIFCRSLYSYSTITDAHHHGRTPAALTACPLPPARTPAGRPSAPLQFAAPPLQPTLRSLFLVSKGGSVGRAHAPGGSGLRPGLFSCLLRPHESGSVKDLQ